MATKHYTCREYADLKRRIKIQERELAQCGGTAAGYIAHYSDVSAVTAAGFFNSNLENLIHLKQELLACDMRREAKRKEQATIAYAPLTQEMIDLAYAHNNRIALEGVARKLTVSILDGKAVAWELRTRPGRRPKHPVYASVEPEGQPAKLV